MIFHLFIKILTTLLFIGFSNAIFKARDFFYTIKIFGSNLSTFVKIVTLASLYINLIVILDLLNTHFNFNQKIFVFFFVVLLATQKNKALLYTCILNCRGASVGVKPRRLTGLPDGGTPRFVHPTLPATPISGPRIPLMPPHLRSQYSPPPPRLPKPLASITPLSEQASSGFLEHLDNLKTIKKGDEHPSELIVVSLKPGERLCINGRKVGFENTISISIQSDIENDPSKKVYSFAKKAAVVGTGMLFYHYKDSIFAGLENTGILPSQEIIKQNTENMAKYGIELIKKTFNE